MLELNLPPYEYRIKREENGSMSIWDTTRHRYVSLTPEEWVRQHFIAFLVGHRGFPAGRIGNEITLSLNGRIRRCDTLVYDQHAAPLMLIEYKAPHIPITQQVFDQIVRYNMVFCVPYIVVSNGMSHYCCHIDYSTHSYTFLHEIPQYDDLKI